jgi:hypothetical protein
VGGQTSPSSRVRPQKSGSPDADLFNQRN